MRSNPTSSSAAPSMQFTPDNGTTAGPKSTKNSEKLVMRLDRTTKIFVSDYSKPPVHQQERRNSDVNKQYTSSANEFTLNKNQNVESEVILEAPQSVKSNNSSSSRNKPINQTAIPNNKNNLEVTFNNQSHDLQFSDSHGSSEGQQQRVSAKQKKRVVILDNDASSSAQDASESQHTVNMRIVAPGEQAKQRHIARARGSGVEEFVMKESQIEPFLTGKVYATTRQRDMRLAQSHQDPQIQIQQ